MQNVSPTTLKKAQPTRASYFPKVLRGLGAFFANIAGYVLLALAILVAIETLGRKLFGFSLQGVDEVGGYALAVSSSLAFTTALVERAHIRIELLHLKLPMMVQTALNWLSIVLIVVFANLLAWVCLTILLDTISYGSTAPTPWATPLIYPQGVWYAGIAIFALVSLAMAVHATWLLLTGKVTILNRLYGPKEAVEEIADELADLNRR
jgi:TRAP-type C4-dicarboxylate transport system permease small subunit